MNDNDTGDNDNDTGLRPAPWVRGLVIVLVVVLFVVAILAYAKLAFGQQNYLPPQRYIDPQTREELAEPSEYYAEDWIVLDPKGRTVCKDPYVRKDVKIVQCVSDEKVR